MLRDKIAEHEKMMSYAETSVSKEMIIDNYKLSRRVAQTIKSRLQDSGASLRDAGPTCLMSGNISIEDEGHMLGTIQYSLSPLYAALLLGDDEAAKDFYEQGADIMGNQNSISYNVNNAFQTHSMFLQEIWAALLYRSWIDNMK